MFTRTSFIGVLTAALFAAMTPAPAGAQTYDKLANLTFNRPVQVPGTTLAAGTYRFRLTNPESSRNIVQVLSHDGSIVHAMFYTMPDRRMETTDDAVLTFKETPAGVAPIARSLFYGDELSGYEFVYLGRPPVMTPSITPQPPITYTPMPAPAAPLAAPVPTPAPVTPPPVAFEPAPKSFESAPPLAEGELVVAAPAELPKTASLLPLVAGGGFASLVLALGLSLVRRRFV